MPPDSCKTSVPVDSASKCRRISADAISHRTPPVQYISTRFPLVENGVCTGENKLSEVGKCTGTTYHEACA